MEQRNTLEEYSKRPSKDKRCVEIIMCFVLLIVLATIAIRFLIKEF